MSGVYIPGAAMPESCNLCFAEFDGDCLLNHDIICTCSPVTRSADCPLVPVPDHGRLVDGDKIVKGCKDKDGRYISQFAAVVGEAVEAAPTVIPASKEKEG